jgi:hypothetical protein
VKDLKLEGLGVQRRNEKRRGLEENSSASTVDCLICRKSRNNIILVPNDRCIKILALNEFNVTDVA